ncbi:low molecular weight phosphotyrosine protein phosphatase [Phyllobacterium zundukense]|jgi:protein-tyrosine phosphatase|uniref:Low molecular weight phosphotyrosine protein phosphatase n=2 Tax=Phyllobacterium zundukense TaxID=1867719 RepID=A0ACD4D7T6_9HYPH|nr:low molecular weight protein-tyrosine-phosphatase [Phyllobacterium zundukense]UXN61917.1 low molecular weight phosphotyrosine protein phosphatase [Phyllobacterium zundukense]
MTSYPLHSVLFVCLGNICRSPLAEGVFRSVLVAEGKGDGVVIDSAGTNGYHTGELPDERSIAVASRHGIDISGQRCRQLITSDFTRFDLIVGMDRQNIAMIQTRRPSVATAEVGMFHELAFGDAKQIPDPYYGTSVDFERVYRMILAASKGLSARF